MDAIRYFIYGIHFVLFVIVIVPMALYFLRMLGNLYMNYNYRT
ncbi:hypothetical protein HMPREF3191_00343 [Veillonellaceae bacterium DNF00626]|nr:hypothetical protein HMPREF3191_00343 [Veillonellaceae bacterium DNF00626]